MKAQVIAVANNKGGVGKTAFVANVGSFFALKGKKTLLLDLDGQSNLTDSFLSEAEVETSIAEALSEKKPLPIVSLKENLFLVPSDFSTGHLKQEALTNLQEALTALAPLYDIILIDTPPSLGDLTASALFCSSKVVVPLVAEPSALKGLLSLNELIENIKKVNKKLSLFAIVLCFYEERKRLTKLIKGAIEKNFTSLLCENTIRRNVSIAEAMLERKDVFSTAPKSKGAEDFKAVGEELLHRMEQQS